MQYFEMRVLHSGPNREAERSKSGMENLNVNNRQRLERVVTPQWYFQYSRRSIRK